MNGNPYTANWIGATAQYPIYEYINKVGSNSSNFTINTSNIIENHLYNTSNILQTQIKETSNLIHKDENSNTIIRITAQNPFYPISGDPVELYFKNVNGDTKTKINQDGELMVYHPSAPLPAGYSPGWWGVENKIANVITDTQGLRFDVTNLQAATGAAAITDASSASAAVAGAAAGAASAAATTAASGAIIGSGDYGSVALGIAGGSLLSVLGYLSYQAQKESNLTSNGFTEEAAVVNSYIANTKELIADNIGNIVTAKGFVHSNILFAQNYISSNTAADLYLLKTGNINLNQVNNWITTEYGIYYDITDGTLAINATPTAEDFLKVGGQTTIQGELICENRIKENNLYLSNVYATINNLNITSNILNGFIDANLNLSSNYTSNTSNIFMNNLSNVLIPYATSNAVKSIVEFDMPVLAKHYAFYILITTSININGTTYYKYDINLSSYTKKGLIQIGGGSNDPYRIFKIRAFYATSYFSTLVNGLADVVFADIFMSFKANSSGGLGSAGLNICSIGNIPNPNLTSVPSNNLFFMRNGADSIDYITVVPKSAADVRVVIEDLLG
jgi:hypothetical protein